MTCPTCQHVAEAIRLLPDEYAIPLLERLEHLAKRSEDMESADKVDAVIRQVDRIVGDTETTLLYSPSELRQACIGAWDAGYEFARQSSQPAPSKHEEALKERLRAVLKGCPKCDYDEAEGVLYAHCHECTEAVTREAWLIVSGDDTPTQPDLRALREAAEWSRTRLAAAMGWTPAGIANLEVGNMDFTPEYCERIAAFWDLPADTVQAAYAETRRRAG